MFTRYSIRSTTRISAMFLSVVLMFSLVLVAFCGCDTQKQEAFDSADDITAKAIEEFLNLTNVPRPSFHTEKVLAYLESFAEQHGFTPCSDDYGNFWMDIPATKGYENYPKVILQGHMDMVCVSKPGLDIDFESTPITAIVGDETITADGTSLGADDGASVGVILAIVESNVAHGPLRALITTDEEVGMLGAAALDPKVIDSDYMINVDNEFAGQICYSTAGGFQSSISNKYETETISADKTVWQLYIGNLLGGHSGVEIDKNRLNAIAALTEILQGVIDSDIPINLISFDAGTANNVITPSGTVTFAISDDKEAELAEIVQSIKSSLALRYPNENIECTLQQQNVTDKAAISPTDSAQLISLVRYFPQGVISMSKKTDGLVETSSNMGIITLANGSVAIRISTRSCVTAELDRLEADFREQTEKYGYIYTSADKYSGWDGDPDSPLLKLTEKAFAQTGVEPEPIAVHAGLECSYFASMRDGIQMVSIGPDISGAHTTGETLQTKSIAPIVATIMYCLSNINTL